MDFQKAVSFRVFIALFITVNLKGSAGAYLDLSCVSLWGTNPTPASQESRETMGESPEEEVVRWSVNQYFDGRYLSALCSLDKNHFRKIHDGRFSCHKACVLHLFGVIDWNEEKEEYRMGKSNIPSESNPDTTIVRGLADYFRGTILRRKRGIRFGKKEKVVLNKMAKEVIMKCKSYYVDLLLKKNLNCDKWGPLYQCVQDAWSCDAVKRDGPDLSVIKVS